MPLRPGERRKPTLQRVFTASRYNAGVRGIPFELTFQEFIRLTERAAGRCEVTGVAFEQIGWTTRRHPFRMSIDRRNMSKGYTYRNCRLVCVAANIAMGEWGERVLFSMMRAMLASRRLRAKRIR